MGARDGAAADRRWPVADCRPFRTSSSVVGRGENWEEALEDVEWADGDVLVVGSSSIGPVARVFLGSRAAKIVRHSPVPVVVVPRGAAAELAAEAEEATPARPAR